MVLDQLARLQAATACVLDGQRAGDTAERIIQRLIAGHGATRRCTPKTNVLRVAGIATSSTWSRDQGLLDAWGRLAARRILQLEGKSA